MGEKEAGPRPGLRRVRGLGPFDPWAPVYPEDTFET